MKPKTIIAGVGFLGVAIIGLHLMGQSGDESVPFFTTPTTEAYSFSSGVKLFARSSSGYASLRFAINSPYSLLSSASALAELVSGGVTLNSPSAPDGVAPASQVFALADFTGNQSLGGVYVDPDSNRSGISVYLGNPSFLFQSAMTYTVGTWTQSVLAADFNGDGFPDLAVPYSGDGSSNGGVGILLNNQSGGFADSVSYPGGEKPVSVASLDLNHDDALDLAVANNSAAGTLQILMGRPDGTFSVGANYMAGAKLSSVILADFTEDGNPDVAATDLDGSVHVLQGNGAGGVQLLGKVDVSSSALGYLAAGDLNHDQHLDLAITNLPNGTVSVALGRGDGTFQILGSYAVTNYPQSLVLTDFDQDGNLDIINGTGDQRGLGPALSSGSIDFLYGKGDGTLRGTQVIDSGAQGTTFVVAADFDGDGNQDAITNDPSQSRLLLMLGSPNGHLGSASEVSAAKQSQIGGQGATTGDFNGDERPDLVVTETSSNEVAVFLNGASGFQIPSKFSSQGDNPILIETADLDGDGKLDLTVVNSNSPGNVAIFSGGGNGAFNPVQTYSAGSVPAGLAIADLNGDQKPDLLVSDAGDQYSKPPLHGTIHMFLNTSTAGAIQFSEGAMLSAGLHPAIVAAADLDDNGTADIVAATTDDKFHHSMAVLTGGGDGSFQPAKLVDTAFGTSVIQIQDFNQDEVPDLAVAHCCGATQMGFYKGLGNADFLPEIPFLGGNSPKGLAVGDMNRDQLPDLITSSGNSGNGGVSVLLNDGQPQAVTVNAASFSTDAIAPDSIASVFGSSLASGTELTDATVVITDSTGTDYTCVLFAVTPGQINFLVPAIATGTATVTVTSSDGTVSAGSVNVTSIAPGLFAIGDLLNGLVVYYDASGKQTGFDYTVQLDPNHPGQFLPKPISLTSAEGPVYLLIYGTGIRGAALNQVMMNVGQTMLDVKFAGAQGQFDGEDQANILLDPSLAGLGEATIDTTVAGKATNSVRLIIQ